MKKKIEKNKIKSINDDMKNKIEFEKEKKIYNKDKVQNHRR